ncbi:MAG: inositol monophosphatase family protein [Sandaracinaceae bacterium]
MAGETARALEEALSITRAAGDLQLGAFGGPVATSTKRSPSDLVTEVDLASERLVRDRLATAFPDHVVVGEEQGGAVTDDGPVWYVDPVDGTTNFAHGHPWFSISLALFRDGQPEVGVVHAPALALTFAAARGQGATRNGRPCRVSSVTDIERSLLATGFGSRRATRPDNNYREFVALDGWSHGVRRCASAALELAHVAAGAYDGFWDDGLGPWDLAAGVLLIREAGGTVSARDGGPFRLAGGGVVATNGPLHTNLLAALDRARRSSPPVEVPARG